MAKGERLVAKDGDVYFYREQCDGRCRKGVLVNLSPMDWLELSRQKLALLNLLANDHESPVWGIIHLIDHIQDQAAQLGHPVVWFTEEPSESLMKQEPEVKNPDS